MIVLSPDKGAEKEKAPGFVEKLVTQIVRNVEVHNSTCFFITSEMKDIMEASRG